MQIRPPTGNKSEGSKPTNANTVVEIKNWLDERHIDYGNVTLKADLLDLVN